MAVTGDVNRTVWTRNKTEETDFVREWKEEMKIDDLSIVSCDRS